MITIIQGTPGSGKSSVATVDMLEFLESGGVVACNYDLVPDWATRLASYSMYVRWFGKDPLPLAHEYWSRAFRIGTSDTIMELSDKIEDLAKGKIAKQREGRGRLYLDEAQLLFNSRSWKDNMSFIEFFTQHRKLGWDVYLISHTMEMIDKQIRGLIEYESRLRNMQKVKIFGLIPVAYKPLFLSIVRYAGISAGSGSIAYRRLYTLRKKYSELYDSMEVFAFNESSIKVTNQGIEPSAIPIKKNTNRINPAPASSWPNLNHA